MISSYNYNNQLDYDKDVHINIINNISHDKNTYNCDTRNPIIVFMGLRFQLIGVSADKNIKIAFDNESIVMDRMEDDKKIRQFIKNNSKTEFIIVSHLINRILLYTKELIKLNPTKKFIFIFDLSNNKEVNSIKPSPFKDILKINNLPNVISIFCKNYGIESKGIYYNSLSFFHKDVFHVIDLLRSLWNHVFKNKGDLIEAFHNISGSFFTPPYRFQEYDIKFLYTYSEKRPREN